MMNASLQKIPEWHDVDDHIFRRDIVTEYRPAVLKGFVKHWPVVQHAMKSSDSVCQYLTAFDNGTEVDALLLAPEERGQISYREDMNGFTFLRNTLPISRVIEQIARYSQFSNPPSVAVQSALITKCLPGFLEENKLSVLDQSVAPRIWMGNAITTPAHIDESNNIACVVAGKRRFTLFPPEQATNLYLGPVDFTPTGSPISMVKFDKPDLNRFPKFQTALAAAQIAELEPGDAIYIPSMWWHHVESLSQLNILINYWWRRSLGSVAKTDSAFDCLMHCLVSMNGLESAQKQAWRAIFDHYVFDAESDPAGHIAAHRRGVLGGITPEVQEEIKAWLMKRMQGDVAK